MKGDLTDYESEAASVLDGLIELVLLCLILGLIK